MEKLRRPKHPTRNTPCCSFCRFTESCSGACVCMNCWTVWMPMNYSSFDVCPRCGAKPPFELCINGEQSFEGYVMKNLIVEFEHALKRISQCEENNSILRERVILLEQTLFGDPLPNIPCDLITPYRPEPDYAIRDNRLAAEHNPFRGDR